MLMGIPDLNLLAVIPLAALMFIKAKPRVDAPKAELNACPRCQAALVRNARYCTSCGWDLAETYEPEAVSPEADSGEKEAAAAPPAEDTAPTLASEVAADAPVEAPTPASAAGRAGTRPTALHPAQEAGEPGAAHRRRHDRARGDVVQPGANPRVHRPIHQSHRLGPHLRRGLGQAGRGLRPTRQGQRGRRRPPQVGRPKHRLTAAVPPRRIRKSPRSLFLFLVPSSEFIPMWTRGIPWRWLRHRRGRRTRIRRTYDGCAH